MTFRLRWHVLAVVVLAALPEVINLLSTTDLHPLLAPFFAAKDVDFLIALLPFVLAFLKPLVHMEKRDGDTH